MDETIILWPGGAPLAVGNRPEDTPSITVRRPLDGTATGAAIVLCPGGGYTILADVENGPIWRWLNQAGITVFVLKSRLSPHYRHPAPLLDAARAVRTVRHRAAEWHVDPRRLGIMGFSAGGHLASTLATHFDYGDPGALDPIDRESCRPDVAVLGYPVITMGEDTHGGSRRNLLGSQPDPELVRLLSNEKQVTPETPPTFLVHSVADAAVRVENSVAFGMALRRAGVPFEMHLFENGRHGFSLAADEPGTSHWPSLCVEWLKRRGFAR